MSEDKETVTIQIPANLTFGNYDAEEFDRILSFFDWSLNNKKIFIYFENPELKSYGVGTLLRIYANYLWLNDSKIVFDFKSFGVLTFEPSSTNLDKILSSFEFFLERRNLPFAIENSQDCEKALEIGKRYIERIGIEYEITIRSVLNELLYNSLEHGKNENKTPALLQFAFNPDTFEVSFIVADVGIGIRRHLRQTYPTLANDSEAVLHALKPRISGTFGRPKTGYETKNNAGVGLYFSSNIVQRLKGDMFIVSGNGFVHISPTEIVANELDNQWKGTFVYVKIKIGEIEDLNLQKMISEIREAIPKQNKITEDNSFYFNVSNYFGKYAEDKDKAKKIRDEKLLPAIAENKTLTIDFEDIISAPHSLLNAMLATPIERLGLAAYKKIKIINASPDIRETLDFIFEDNTPND
jgi:hypothetical protein